jgi:hypothetical protein
MGVEPLIAQAKEWLRTFGWRNLVDHAYTRQAGSKKYLAERSKQME